MSIVIRPADPDDAAGACEVVCNSIVHACTRDHLRDPQRLLRWLQNKTVDNFAAWLRAPANSGFIALIDGRAVGIALIDTDGDIRLCYVRAERLGQGIGGGLLDAMIARACVRAGRHAHPHAQHPCRQRVLPAPRLRRRGCAARRGRHDLVPACIVVRRAIVLAAPIAPVAITPDHFAR